MSGSVRRLGAVRRLRPLSETECYVRLYGRDEDTVKIIAVIHRRPGRGPRLSGESLRRLFEKRLDSREPEAA
jgi:hypothetical protein